MFLAKQLQETRSSTLETLARLILIVFQGTVLVMCAREYSWEDTASLARAVMWDFIVLARTISLLANRLYSLITLDVEVILIVLTGVDVGLLVEDHRGLVCLTSHLRRIRPSNVPVQAFHTYAQQVRATRKAPACTVYAPKLQSLRVPCQLSACLTASA